MTIYNDGMQKRKNTGYHQKRGDFRRKLILEHCLVIIGEKGLTNFSMSELSRRSNVPAGTLYQYYSSKSDILLALVSNSFISTNIKAAEKYDRCQNYEEIKIAAYENFIAFYETIKATPALIDLWNGFKADKKLQQVDKEDTQHNAQLLASAILKYRSPPDQGQLINACILLMDLASTVAKRATRSKSKNIKKLLKTMFEMAWKNMEKSL